MGPPRLKRRARAHRCRRRPAARWNRLTLWALRGIARRGRRNERGQDEIGELDRRCDPPRRKGPLPARFGRCLNPPHGRSWSRLPRRRRAARCRRGMLRLPYRWDQGIAGRARRTENRSGPLTTIHLGVRILPETPTQRRRLPVANLLVEQPHPAKIRSARLILRCDGPELAAG
jgi:hypothetical protein